MSRKKSWYQIKAQSDESAEVLIYDEIGFWGVTAAEFVRDLEALGDVDRITVRINSPGGDVFDGITIYNALRRHAADIEVRIDGLAASAASFIAMAGDPVIMPENAMLMIHEPFGIALGGAGDMRAMAEALDRIGTSIVSMYAAKAALDRAEIAQMMADETWISAAEAVEAGFADEMVETVEISAAFDLSAYRNVPQDWRGKRAKRTPAARRKPVWTAEDAGRMVAALGEIAEAGGRYANEFGAARPPTMEASAGAGATREERSGMDKDKKAVAQPQADATGLTDEDIERARAEAVTAERTRQAELDELAMPGQEALLAVCKADGTSVAEAAKLFLADHKSKAERLLKARAADDPPAGDQAALPPAAHSVVQIGASGEDPLQRREWIARAFLARATGQRPTEDPVREYAVLSCVDIARQFLPNGGRGLRPAQIIENALTTSDFPFTLAAGADKVLQGRYEAAPSTYTMVSSSMDIADFKRNTLIRFGDFPALLEVKEDGEYQYGPMGEHPEYIQLATFGRLVQLTRQALVNDDLGAFLRMAGMIGEAVARFENKMVWDVITTNAAMSDGTALFHADHGNLASSGAAPDATTIGAGKAAMRKQTSVDKNPINLEPSLIAGPTDLETKIEQVLSDLIVPVAPDNMATRTQRALTTITEPLLDADSVTAWYLFASPAREAGLVYANLRGVAGPETFTDDPFTRDGMTIKVRRDFAAAAQDWRGMYKDPGA